MVNYSYILPGSLFSNWTVRTCEEPLTASLKSNKMVKGIRLLCDRILRNYVLKKGNKQYLIVRVYSFSLSSLSLTLFLSLALSLSECD